MTHPLRAGIAGSGQLASHLYDQAAALQIEVVAAGTSSPHRIGKDVGSDLGHPAAGRCFESVESMMARTDLDVVLHAGPGGESLWSVLEAGARTGLDVVTSAGLFDRGHDDLTAKRTLQLDIQARASGSRLLATGIFPGFVADTLPLLFATTLPDPVSVEVRQVSDISSWSAGVLKDEVGIGQPVAARGNALLAYVDASARTIADGLGLQPTEWVTESHEVPADFATLVAGISVAPRRTVGFSYQAVGFVSGEPRVTVTWVSGAPDDDLGASIRLTAPDDLSLEVRVSPFSAYLATAVRMLKSLRPLRTLPPGIQRGFTLPIGPT